MATSSQQSKWIEDLPSRWQELRLKYIASYNDEVLHESTPKTQKIEYVDIGSVSAMGEIISTETMLFADAPSRARRIVRQGDVLVSTVRTYLKAIAPVRNQSKNLIASTGFAVIRSGPAAVSNYLAFALRAEGFIGEVISRSVGISYPAINATDLVDISIPIPPLEEQTKIAKFLDYETAQIDGLIEKQQQLIALLKEKRQAVISHAVTKGLNPNAPMRDSGIEWLGEVPAHWEVLTYRHVVTRVIVGIAEAATHAYAEVGVPIVRSTNIKTGIVDETKMLFIKPEFASVLESKALFAGDIVTTRTGANVGVSAVVPESLHMSQCFTLVISTPKPESNPHYYKHFINSETGKIYIGLTAWGSGQPNISVPIIQGMYTVAPPRPEQDEIVAFITRASSKYDGLINKTELAIELLQERRTALISAAVTGKIDVRGWQPPPSPTQIGPISKIGLISPKEVA